MVNRPRLMQQLELHEGLRLTPYKDSEGNWTIGIGYNVTGRGWEMLEIIIGRKVNPTMAITADEARVVCAADIDRIEPSVIKHFPEYVSLNEVRQRVVMDMAYNLGYRALGFNNTIIAIRAQQWSTAVRELYKSKWSHQVGDGEGGKFDRCDRLAKMLLTGLDYIN